MLLVDMGDILNDSKFGLPGQSIWGQSMYNGTKETYPEKINRMNMPQMKKVVI